MSKILSKYIFTGFGFDVLLKDIVIKKVDGEEYPDININELKLKTAKALLVMPVKMTGHQIKFLRTFLKLSYDDLSRKIDVPASTLRSWEKKGHETSGFSVEHEKLFRNYAIHSLFEIERSKMEKELILTKFFSEPQKNPGALDVAAVQDYVFVP